MQSRFGVIFCGECESLLVDSGFDSPASLKCCQCGNINKFKVGKVSIDDSNPLIEALLNQAYADARIKKNP